MLYKRDKLVRLVLDSVGNRYGGGATVLLELLQAARTLEEIETITVLASPAAFRKFVMPEWEKLGSLTSRR